MNEYNGQGFNKKYSSFSQMKGLLWKDWYDAILDQDFKSPIGGVIDLTDKCNLKCYWCNAQNFRAPRTLSYNHVIKLIDILANWGIKSICYAGGGEPTIHSRFPDIIKYTGKKGLEIEISSNATVFNDKIIDAIIRNVTFTSLSIDAGTKDTWRNIKNEGHTGWDDVIKNVKQLCNRDYQDRVDKTYKILIVPQNQNELFIAGKKAKEIGFNNFYARPAGFSNIKGVEMKGTFDREIIENEFKKLETLEDKRFTVYKSFGRTDEEFKEKHKFDKCRSTSLIALFCADGFSYPCIARRQENKLRMCKHLNIKEYWNSEEHHKLLRNIDLDKCPLCPFSHYNEQLMAYKSDYMFKWFP